MMYRVPQTPAWQPAHLPHWHGCQSHTPGDETIRSSFSDNPSSKHTTVVTFIDKNQVKMKENNFLFSRNLLCGVCLTTGTDLPANIHPSQPIYLVMAKRNLNKERRKKKYA